MDLIRVPVHRLTRQRRLVFDILREGQEHLDADTIYQQARQRGASISLATVYRALAFLKKTGLVQEHQLGESHGHFEPTQKIPHYHFTCRQCGRVVEFDAPQVMEVVNELCQGKGLQVTTVHLLLSGTCDRCRPAG